MIQPLRGSLTNWEPTIEAMMLIAPRMSG